MKQEDYELAVLEVRIYRPRKTGGEHQTTFLCNKCHDRGYLVGTPPATGKPERGDFIERCDACAKYHTDEQAAIALAKEHHVGFRETPARQYKVL